ncbi:MAG TPA: MFS transporter [Ilumatobacter sp.]|nr:MFS transporter [Ilumatobacter sp.]
MSNDKFPGWRVVTGAFIILATASGFTFYGLAVLLNAFSNERNWKVSTLSLATTVFFFVAGIAGVGVARLISRFDARKVVAVGGLLAGVSLGLLGQVTELWQLFACYAVMAVGFAAAGLVPATTVVTRWFVTQRSVALSVASTGLSAGGILITPAMKWSIDEYGLEATTPWLGLLFVIGTVPFALWLLRSDPATYGWLPDGERVRADVAPLAPTGTPFADARRSRFFVLVSVGYVFALGSQVGALQQLVKLVEERTDSRTASAATLVVAGFSVFARLVGGRVVSRVPMVPFTVGLCLLQMVAVTILAFGQTTVVLFTAIALFGASIGNILMLQPLLLAERFGVRDYPRIFSRSQLWGLLGTAGGPLLLGFLHDEAGGYRAAYLVAGGLSALGAALIFASGSAAPEFLTSDEDLAAVASTA